MALGLNANGGVTRVIGTLDETPPFPGVTDNDLATALWKARDLARNASARVGQLGLNIAQWVTLLEELQAHRDDLQYDRDLKSGQAVASAEACRALEEPNPWA